VRAGDPEIAMCTARSNRCGTTISSLQGLVGLDLNGKNGRHCGNGQDRAVVARIPARFRHGGCRLRPLPDAAWAIREGITYVDPSPWSSLSDVISLHVSPDARKPPSHHPAVKPIDCMKPGGDPGECQPGWPDRHVALIEALE